MLHDTRRFARKYDETIKQNFLDYVHSQIAKIDVPELTAEENDFLVEKMLTMYANPLKNKLKALLGGIE